VHQQSQDRKPAGYTYGPVPSRRLGFSLGIDIMPFKTCSHNCIYCQLGKTTGMTLLRREYTPVHEILSEIEETLKRKKQIDFLTFSGSGEPTLHKGIGYLINELKHLTNIPIAVLTNGSLLHIPEVRDDLKNADLVIPTLCTADEAVFRKIHRGHKNIDLAKLIEGYISFRKIFNGKIWLEVMLIKGINDKPEQVQKLKAVIDRIGPDKIQLNTVVRPPSEAYAGPVTMEVMNELREILGEKCEIIVDFAETVKKTADKNTLEMITAIISRRPITVDDLVKITKMHTNEILKYIQLLSQKGKILISRHEGKEFYVTRGNDD
jgi:wyosine [tRNA(Phe)-imidazoG37] synthetase (radical SAM superfamily)